MYRPLFKFILSSPSMSSRITYEISVSKASNVNGLCVTVMLPCEFWEYHGNDSEEPAFYNVTSCNLVDIYWRFKVSTGSVFSTMRWYIPVKYLHTYRVIQEESALLWEMTVWVILSKKDHTNMCPILNGYGVMGIFKFPYTPSCVPHLRNQLAAWGLLHSKH